MTTEPETPSVIETDDPTGHPVAWDTFDELQQAYRRIQSELNRLRNRVAGLSERVDMAVEQATDAGGWEREATRLREENERLIRDFKELGEDFRGLAREVREPELARLREIEKAAREHFVSPLDADLMLALGNALQPQTEKDWPDAPWDKPPYAINDPPSQTEKED